jgi:PIN domain nuclease of toxin-antitoxin system
MRIIIDTHIYFWWVTGDRRLPPEVRGLLDGGSAGVLMSAVVPWELATKSRLGKWPSARRVLDEIEQLLGAGQMTALPITTLHAKIAGLFPANHRDPFDRLLAAQARCENAPLVTVDSAFGGFDVELIP